jgi:predicted amidophosphoribosyltransferase
MTDYQYIFNEDIREKKMNRPHQSIAKKKPKSVITPYDLNKKDIMYRPGKTVCYQLPQCPKCHRHFKTAIGRMYCPTCQKSLAEEISFTRHSISPLHKKVKLRFEVYTPNKKYARDFKHYEVIRVSESLQSAIKAHF